MVIASAYSLESETRFGVFFACVHVSAHSVQKDEFCDRALRVPKGHLDSETIGQGFDCMKSAGTAFVCNA